MLISYKLHGLESCKVKNYSVIPNECNEEETYYCEKQISVNKTN